MVKITVGEFMDNKTKNDILKLIMIENKILEVYRNIIKKEITNENKDKELKKLKELKIQEEFLNDLEYEELNKISDFIQNYDINYTLITQRIINLVNKIIDEEYFEECFEEEELEDDDYYSEDD